MQIVSFTDHLVCDNERAQNATGRAASRRWQRRAARARPAATTGDSDQRANWWRAALSLALRVVSTSQSLEKTPMIASLSPLQNTLLTVGCLLALVWLGYLIMRMFKAIRRDARDMDKERERELRDWNDGE